MASFLGLIQHQKNFWKKTYLNTTIVFLIWNEREKKLFLKSETYSLKYHHYFNEANKRTSSKQGFIARVHSTRIP